MSDTPRTDAEVELIEWTERYPDGETDTYSRQMVDADFAAELEAENAALRKVLHQMRTCTICKYRASNFEHSKCGTCGDHLGNWEVDLK